MIEFGRHMPGRAECLCDDKGRDRCILHAPVKTGAELRQIAELENPTLRTPQQQVESLLAMATLAQGQLKEPLQLLNFRDRQIFVAIDALEHIRDTGCNGCGCAKTALTEGCPRAAKAIEEMREIHKESLHESV